MYDIPVDMKLNIFNYLKNEFLNWRILNKEYFGIYSFLKNDSLILNKSSNLNWRKRPNNWIKVNLLLKKNKLVTSGIYFSHNCMVNENLKSNILLYAKYHILKNKWIIYENKNIIAFLKFDNFKMVLYRPNNIIWAIFSTKFKNRYLNIKLLKINSLSYENKCENEDKLFIRNKKPQDSNDEKKRKKILYLKFENKEINRPSIKNTSFINYENNECVFEIGKNTNNEVIAFYKKPLHGLLAFSLCIIKLTS
tara:strand:+ start:1566 stop:2318 length:753 start_codon:yes stop_codon:yes gene_type:complete